MILSGSSVVKRGVQQLLQLELLRIVFANIVMFGALLQVGDEDVELSVLWIFFERGDWDAVR